MAGLERDASRPDRTPKINASLGRRVVPHDDAAEVGERHALQHAQHGPSGGHQRGQRGSYLAQSRPKPHWVENFKISNDPEFAEKLEDIVGLYLNPPEHTLVLCVDEKSQIQALDRAQPAACR